ncbi:hypothetical protein XPA_004736 [Xanthoria parietina]
MPRKLLPDAKFLDNHLLIIGPVAAVYERFVPEYQGSSEPLAVSCACFLIVVDNGFNTLGTIIISVIG